MKIKLFLLYAFLVSFTTVNTAVAQTPYRPIVGQPHDDFVLPSVDDRKLVALSDYRGKKVLLVHFASW